MKAIFTLLFIIGLSSVASGQENKYYKDSLGCECYYDTILQKKVYSVVHPFPSYDDSTSMEMFGFFLVKEMGKDGFNYQLAFEEDGFSTFVPVIFIVNEEGFMENIQILRKTEEEYSILDAGVIRTFNRLKNHQWKPGECNGTKVPVLVIIPLNINFKGY